MHRIGLTQRVEVLAERRERRDCLDQAWTVMLQACECWPIPLPNRIDDVPGMVAALRLDAVILTGGNDCAAVTGSAAAAVERDRFEQALLDWCARRRLPVLGVCRGFQALVLQHGGRLSAVPGHVATRHRITVAGRAALPLADGMEVNSYHRFGVRLGDLGPGLRALATAADGSVEALAHAELPQWGIMWHPEREADPAGLATLLGPLLARTAP